MSEKDNILGNITQIGREFDAGSAPPRNIGTRLACYIPTTRAGLRSARSAIAHGTTASRICLG
jgi:hypothetical protein